MSCGVSRRRGSDPALLWPVATAPIRPLAWKTPYAAGAAQEKTKRPKKKMTVRMSESEEGASAHPKPRTTERGNAARILSGWRRGAGWASSGICCPLVAALGYSRRARRGAARRFPCGSPPPPRRGVPVHRLPGGGLRRTLHAVGLHGLPQSGLPAPPAPDFRPLRFYVGKAHHR